MADDFAAAATPDIGADTGGDVDLGSTVDTGTETSTEQTSEQDIAGDKTTDKSEEFRAVKNGQLSPEAKAALDRLKLENPKLAKAVSRALFAEERLRRELPGGFKEVQELRNFKQQIDEGMGGETGFQEATQELDGWRTFDQQYTAGDPKVLEFLTETPEAQQAFMKIIPDAIGKFAEVNPEGFSAYFGRVMASDMNEHGIPLTLQRLGDFLRRASFTDERDGTEAGTLHKALIDYYNRVAGIAQKPLSAKVEPKADDPRARDLETREQQLTRKEWSGETEKQHGQIFAQAWKKNAIPPEKAALVRRLYPIHLQEKLAARKDFNGNMNRYFSAKQKDGFLRLHDSTFKEIVPLALRSAMAEAGINSKKIAPVAKGITPQLPGRKLDTGFIPVAKKPDFRTEVDTGRTGIEMYAKKQAILKNGKRVQWS